MEPSSRELGDAAQDGYEMMYLKNQEERAQNPALVKHLQPASATAPIPYCNLGFRSCKVGAFYEINHSKLSRKTPEQLKSIRVAMVSEKAVLNVSLRFPSIHSIWLHISDRNYGKREGKKLPSLDEKYVMGSEMASDVLLRRISPQEIDQNRDLLSFWTTPMASERLSCPERGGVVMNNVASKNGTCWSQLRYTGMVQWGKPRQVRFLNPHEECKQGLLSSIATEKEENTGHKCLSDEEDQEEREIKESGEENMKAEPFKVENYSGIKRKLRDRNKSTQKQKRAMCLKPSQSIGDFRSKEKRIKQSIERWSAARYKLAEENMLKIMKAKGAVFGNPILRPALRSEARKRIGDTGLLDHLLKHMAGNVAPGGTFRFQRRHNAEGAMEYWLESADLINVRRQAGVQDPYWTPPHGWKPGDNPTQDPLCARALKVLREEMDMMKKDVQQLVIKRQEENLAVGTAANSKVTNLQRDDEDWLIPLKGMYMELANRKANIEDQMMEIAQSFSKMEEQMKILKSSQYGPIQSELEALPPLLMAGSPTMPSDIERDKKELRQKSKSGMISGEKQEENHGGDKATDIAIEDRAARVRRLKSGFRICKPQGTFLWPNIAISPKSGLHLDDLFVVPTPTSASSSTSSITHFSHAYETHPASPVQPLAEKCPVSRATFSCVSNLYDPFAPTKTHHESQSITTIINASFDLNEVPKDGNGDNTLCGTLNYQRKHQINVENNADMPSFEAEEKEGVPDRRENVIRSCEQKQHKECPTSSCSQFPAKRTSWLGL